MHIPQLNYWAVLVSGVVIFVIGGLWYSPMLFAKKWVALMGKTEEDLKAQAAGPMPFLIAFVSGLLTSFALAVIINHFQNLDALRGGCIGALCWLGFAGAPSFSSAVFSGKPKALWLIDSGFNLVTFIVAGIILALWR